MEVQSLLRQRRSVVGSANVGLAQPECAPQGTQRLGLLPATVFVGGWVVYLLTGVLCTVTPPRAQATAASVSVSSDSVCYRVIRKADYTTVELAFGSPTRRLQALLRLDKVVSSTEKSIKIFSERVMESKTFSCDSENATCYDVVLVTKGEPNADLAHHVIEFDYVNPQVEYYLADVARYNLKLAGEMYASEGYRYWMTSTHLCVSHDTSAPVIDATGALAVDVTPAGGLRTNVSNVAYVHADLLGTSALHAAYHGSKCIGVFGDVEVLPRIAGVESSYLAISDTNLYENEPQAVSTRRRIVELGAACASTLPEYERTYNLYDIDCSNAYASCRVQPSLPYRRIASLELHAHYTMDSRAYFWFKRDKTLETLPGLANTYDSVLIAIVKLMLLVLAAMVMWVRSDRVTSSAYWLYRHCVQVANCLKFSTPATVSSSVIEDAALGFVALGARFAVSMWRMDTLYNDDQVRVCLFEVVASIVSLINWLIRYWVIEPNLPELIGGKTDGKGPLTRLGGSMAIADASSAVLMAFAEPPMLMSAVSRFDNTARLLTGLLISLVTLQRCIFACCCNAIIIEAHDAGRLQSSGAYRWLLITALVMWMYQLTCLAVALADLVATPMAYALGRGIVGNNDLLGAALFMAFTCTALPRLMYTSVKLMDRHMGQE